MRRFLKSIITRGFNCWQPYTRLVLAADIPNWAIANEMRELSHIAHKMNIKVISQKILPVLNNQCVFFGSHFDLLLSPNNWFDSDNRLATAYFHGRPSDGIEAFDICFEKLKANHQKISRIQVSYSAMRDILLESGISPEKIFQIPIGINLDYFALQTVESRANSRERLGVPKSATVVGSFQKDGEGWGDGMEPKMIKGPDIFLETVEILKQTVPDLFILLSGPARGYMKSGLKRLKIPYVHIYQQSYSDIGEMFHALDLYIVSSREEGGPKAVLESMASGVPLVTTRVGQAMDLVEHGRNGWMVDPGQGESLAHWAEYALLNSDKRKSVVRAGLQTAEANSYQAQIPLWSEFMSGFLETNKKSQNY